MAGHRLKRQTTGRLLATGDTTLAIIPVAEHTQMYVITSIDFLLYAKLWIIVLWALRLYAAFYKTEDWSQISSRRDVVYFRSLGSAMAGPRDRWGPPPVAVFDLRLAISFKGGAVARWRRVRAKQEEPFCSRRLLIVT